MDLTALMKLGVQLSVPCKKIIINNDPNKIILEFTLNKQDNCVHQLFICAPYINIPDHSHPDVTTIVTPLSGLVKARRDDKWIKIQGRNYNKSHVVKKGQLHGFETFDEPFVFLTQQIWRVGMLDKIENVSLVDNWDGEGDFNKNIKYL